jgi:hypothetical protein
MSIVFKSGQEYLYTANKNVEPIWLTYVKKNKHEKNRHILFSSEYPSLDYDITTEAIQPGDTKLVPLPQFSEEYVAFKDDDEDKQKAYNIMKSRRS